MGFRFGFDVESLGGKDIMVMVRGGWVRRLFMSSRRFIRLFLFVIDVVLFFVIFRVGFFGFIRNVKEYSF